MTPTRRSRIQLACAVAACSFGVMAASAPAAPATSATPASATASDPRARFEADRAACLSGQTHQAQSTCLREAENAYGEARRGRLADGDVDYRRNQLLRCEPLQGDARAACVARVGGAGKVSGSVESGGVYRELVTVEPGTPAASAPAAGSAREPTKAP